MIEVDARGLSCPEPVMMTNSALKDHPGEKVQVIVDEACSLKNVQKFGKSKGKQVSVQDKGNGEYEISIE